MQFLCKNLGRHTACIYLTWTQKTKFLPSGSSSKIAEFDFTGFFPLNAVLSKIIFHI